ncbi:MAG: SDR family NAD(P)-dependent oxidoreductase [Candidatus Gastranaerophilales bacterium]|nr:SDR family NAD(P)-dependent oxidoreductase [Candidatus Gastranaerophilales bacterium]
MEKVLILGAQTGFGTALAEKYASEGYGLYLADLNVEALEELKQRLEERYNAEVSLLKFNVLEFYTHRIFYKGIDPAPVGAIFAVDYIGDQKRAEKDFLESKKIIDTNYTGLVSILNIMANSFEERQQGFIIGIGAVTGEKYKQDVYTYHSAKTGFMTHLEGIKNRSSLLRMQVLTVNPGFVYMDETKTLETSITSDAVPEKIADKIFAAQQAGKTSLNCEPVLSKLFSFLK